MAVINALEEFNIFDVDLNWFSRNFFADFFLDDAFFEFNGIVYEDLYTINAWDGVTDLGLDLAGTNITLDANGNVVGGTVTGIFEFFWGDNDTLWIEEISVAAADVYQAMLTETNADDLDLFEQALAGEDNIFLSGGNDQMDGFGGNDAIYGFEGDDTLFGSGGDDTLVGGDDGDSLLGGDGNDLLAGEAGPDTLDGGSGIDLATYFLAENGVRADLSNPASNTGEAAGDIFISIEDIGGSKFADTLIGNDGSNLVIGDDGNDQLIGGDGEDTLNGGEGNDILKGGIGADLLYGGSSDPSFLTVQDQGQLFGTDGNVELGTDFFSQSITAGVSGNLAAIEVQYETFGNIETIEYSVIAGGNPADGTLLFSEVVAEPDLSSEGVFRWSLPDLPELFFEVGEQFTFSFQAEAAGVVFAASDPPDYAGGELYEGNTLSDQAGDLAFLTFVRAEDLSGAEDDDRLYGDEGNDTLNGGDGNDRLIGGDGVDVLNGGEGDDVLIDRLGATNTLNGGAGEDRIVTSSGDDSVTGGSERDVIKTFGGADEIHGDEGNDVILSGTENDTVYGGDGDDVIKTSLGDDYVEGGDGNDIIYTWRGNDTAIGGAGDDVIRGDFDDDLIEGGSGNDRLVGAPGRDTFIFREGFEEDRILDFRSGSDLMDFSAHTGVTDIGDLSISQVSTNVVITDGSGGRVVLANTLSTDISEADFVFVA